MTHDLTALADRIDATPAYVSDDLGGTRMRRVDKTTGDDPDVPVILVDATKRNIISSALRAAAVQGEPVAWRYNTFGDQSWRAVIKKPPVHSKIGRFDKIEPLYTAAPPAAGWDEKSTRDIRWLISSARAFLRHFNPCDLAEDKSQQWQSLSHQCDVVERALRHNAPPDTGVGKSDDTTIPDSSDMDARFAWLESKAIDMGYILAPEPEHPDSPHNGGADAGVRETPMQRAEKVGNKIFYSGVHAASAFAISAIAEEIESAVDAALSKPAPVAPNASAELQNDLGDMLRALGMSDAAQPRSPHDVFQSAIAEMKRQLGNASAEAKKDMADWSDLPKDIYVIGAQRVNAVGFDVQCFSVPMVTVPEVRYVRADMVAMPNASAEARWYPIETAPMDGTPIFLYSNSQFGTHTPALCSWWSAERCAEVEGGDPKDFQQGWYYVEDQDDPFCRPTHWMPYQHPHASDCKRVTAPVDVRETAEVSASVHSVDETSQSEGSGRGLITPSSGGSSPPQEATHASDCDKQDGECLYCKGTGENLSNPMNSGACSECGGIGARPSDRTADVTEEELAKIIDPRPPCPAAWAVGQARAILDAFTVGRR